MGIEKYIISLKDEPNCNVFDPRWLEDGTNSILHNEKLFSLHFSFASIFRSDTANSNTAYPTRHLILNLNFGTKIFPYILVILTY